MNNKTKVPKKLILHFFLYFSRFEFALKESGFYKTSPPQENDTPKIKFEKSFPPAKPDWKKYVECLENKFKKERNLELKAACEYILDQPPMIQIIKDNSTTWEQSLRSETSSEFKFLVDMVRCIRNNLFHGSKFNIDVHEQPQRTEDLFKYAIVILDECLRLSPEVKKTFDDAVQF